MDINDMYKDNSLSYKEFLKSERCWLYFNNKFVLAQITDCDEYKIIFGIYLDIEFMFKIKDQQSFNNFKINKFYGP